MACAVGGSALDAGEGADLVPNGVDGPDAQTAVGVAAGVARQEESRGVEVLSVGRALVREVVLDGIEPLAADLVGLFYRFPDRTVRDREVRIVAVSVFSIAVRCRLQVHSSCIRVRLPLHESCTTQRFLPGPVAAL